MIPKYTVAEIIKEIQNNIVSTDNFMQQYDLSETAYQQMMNPTNIWTSKEYHIASDFLNIPLSKLLDFIPEENLSNISFRALENTEEINQLVAQVNDIFNALTYQLKIGGAYDK